MEVAQANGRRRRGRARAVAAVVGVAGAVLATLVPADAQVPGQDPAPDPVPLEPPTSLVFDAEAGLAGVASSANADTVAEAARQGAAGLRISATAAPGFVRWDRTVLAPGRGHASVRTWVRVLDRAPGESVDVLTVQNDLGSAHFDLFVDGRNGRFGWDLFRQDRGGTTWAVETGRWYLVEVAVDFTGDRHRATVRIDGWQQAAISSAARSTTVRSVTLGTVAAKTHTQDYDDVRLAVGDGPQGWLVDEVPLVGDDALWRYRDSGVDPGATWYRRTYDASTWRFGRAEFGAGDGDEVTVVNRLAPAHVTDWFRHWFDAGDAASYLWLEVRLVADDGARVFLNDSQVVRDNLPAGPIGATTEATTARGGEAESRWRSFRVPSTLLRSGPDLLAVDLHQAAAGSPDASLRLHLVAIT